MAIALIFATFVEATFNTDVVQFYVYRSWWFGLIYGLLAVNIFCAASIRYPWKRHQTGFVITHIGLLMTLFSGVVSRSTGIDAQVHVWENHSSELAYDNSYFFDLRIEDGSTPHASSGGTASEGTRHKIDFAPGMFNWSSYQTGFADWEVARPDLARWFAPIFYVTARQRPGAQMFNQDGVQFEVLDYYADCEWMNNTPTIDLRMSMPSQMERGAEGTMRAAKESWIPIQLSAFSTKAKNFRYGIGDSQKAGGGTITFWMAGTSEATEAFLDAAPEGKLGPKGQVILHAQGKRFVLDVEESLGADKKPLDGTELQYKVEAYYPTATLEQVSPGEFNWQERKQEGDEDPKNPTVLISIFNGDEQIDSLTLLANMPQMAIQGHDASVFGDYWFDFGEKSTVELMRGEGGSRIDIIQGVAQGAVDEHSEAAKTLYYRYWNREKIVASGRLPANGKKSEAVDAFTMPIGTLRMYAKLFVPASEPKPQPVAKPFRSSVPMGASPAAKIRMTVDGQTEEFWLLAHQNEPDVGLSKATRHIMNVGGRQVQLSMPIQSYPIGFRIFLEKFNRRLDPGTSQASRYSSDVHYLDREKDRFLMQFDPDSNQSSRIVVEDAINPTATFAVWPKLYWLDESPRGNSIYSIDLSQSEPTAQQLVMRAGTDPRGLVVDSNHQKMWWLDLRSDPRSGIDQTWILEANLDGSQQRPVGRISGNASDLAVDVGANWIFFANVSEKSIGRVRLDGSEMNTSWITDAGVPMGIAASNLSVYWTDDRNDAIRKADYESKSSFVFTYKTKGQPGSIAIDPNKKRLYWTDIEPNGLDPNARKLLSDPSIDRTKPQQFNTKVWWISLDGTSKQPQAYHSELLDKPGGISVDQKSGEVFWTQNSLLKRDVWITMNAPDDYIEPARGRDLRIFQESFSGPYQAGSPEYKEFVPKRSNATEVYKSVFSINYDPGTALRYWGCLFVIGGIACMFYMRAYFFKPKRSGTTKANKRVAESETSSELATATE